MNIRAHHLLCMRNFKGKGYSREFVDNFYGVINKIKKENPPVKIINKPDIICSACPYNHDGCTKKGPDSELKVRDKDKNVIKLLGTGLNKSLKADKLMQLVNKKTGKDTVPNICKDCDWLEYCT